MQRGLASLLLLSFVTVSAAQSPESGEAAEIAAARTLFEANLDAIRNRDRAHYLSLYLRSGNLVRSGATGLALGFEEFARSAGERWPDTFEGTDLQLVRIAPGVVYGTYRYRVRYGAEESAGISERIFLNTADGWRIALTGAIETPGAPPPPRALAGATLVDGSGKAPVRDAVVVMRNGRIDCAGSRSDCPLPEGVTVTDVKGMWITPGLIDAHVHFSQTAWADGRPDAFDARDRHPYENVQAELKRHPSRYFRSYLCSGVTGVFDVGGFPSTLELPERAANDRLAPHVAATGPLLSTLDHWLNLPAERQFIHLADEASGRSGVRYLHAAGTNAVKVWYIANSDLPAASAAGAVRAAGEEAKRLGLPLIVHATKLEEAKIAVDAGASLLVHSVWDTAIDQPFLEAMVRNKVVYSPTLMVGDGYLRLFRAIAAGETPAIDDPNGCVDAATRARLAETPSLDGSSIAPKRIESLEKRLSEERAIGAANLLRLHRAGVVVAMGTDAGNPLTLHGPSVYAEMEAMQAAGLTPMEVLVASTRGGALAMGRGSEIGTVEKGKVADLLIVAADPSANIANLRKLRHVVRGGVMRSVEELSAIASAK
ncbi:MAG TPA: amidohydrolase family protein [Thermoanaerobaculia bacterium]|nr:amidohydrolase family protein [Thermoanaerobaculia bacterium]